MTGASGQISGTKSTDSISGAILLSGNIIELGNGMYRANLYDFDCSGLYIGYNFLASGCVPASFSVITMDAVSGKMYPASGASVIGSVYSGTQVNTFSGTVSLYSGGIDAIQVEAGVNARQALSLVAAAEAGQTSGAGTGTFYIAGANVNTTNRITSTTTQSGNRQVNTLNLPT